MTFLRFLFIVAFVLSIFGCKSKRNQIVNHQRVGKWITIDTLDSIYITKGRYHKDFEIGTWKHFYNGRLIRKSKYHKKYCFTTFYYPNGKIMNKGRSKTETNDTLIHWYYYGKWHFYNSKGELDSIKTYKKE